MVHFFESAKRIARQLLAIGENRFELLLVELEQERWRLLSAILLALGVAAFGLLAGVGLTAAIAVLFWKLSPLIALLALTFSPAISVVASRSARASSASVPMSSCDVCVFLFIFMLRL